MGEREAGQLVLFSVKRSSQPLLTFKMEGARCQGVQATSHRWTRQENAEGHTAELCQGLPLWVTGSHGRHIDSRPLLLPLLEGIHRPWERWGVSWEASQPWWRVLVFFPLVLFRCPNCHPPCSPDLSAPAELPGKLNQCQAFPAIQGTWPQTENWKVQKFSSVWPPNTS